MSSTSFLFFGLMLIPFVLFIIWLIKQDKRRNYMGLAVLVAAIIMAIVVAIIIDAKFMQ